MLDSSLHFDVSYYNAEEAEKFANSGYAKYLDPLVESELTTTFGRFMLATLFREQSPRRGFATRDELRAKIDSRVSTFLDYYDNLGTLTSRLEPNAMLKELIEAGGVGCAISVMDEAFGTHEADWSKIPVGQSKSMDFQVAVSDTGLKLVLEAKGSVSPDVRKKSPSISKHKADILDKKDACSFNAVPDTLFIGTIAAIPSYSGDKTQIWLVDPPAPFLSDSSEKIKLLNRLRYYRNLIYTVVDPFLLTPLANRIRALERMQNHQDLDGLALTNLQGEPIGRAASSLNMDTVDEHGRITGKIFEGSRAYFVGFDLRVLDIIADQNFEIIAKWNSGLAGRQQVDLIYKRPLVPGLWHDAVVRRFDCVIGRSGLVLGFES